MKSRLAERGEDAAGEGGVEAVGGLDRSESAHAGVEHGGSEEVDHAVLQRAEDLPRADHDADGLAADVQLRGEPDGLEACGGSDAQRAGSAEGPRGAADVAAAG